MFIVFAVAAAAVMSGACHLSRHPCSRNSLLRGLDDNACVVAGDDDNVVCVLWPATMIIIICRCVGDYDDDEYYYVFCSSNRQERRRRGNGRLATSVFSFFPPSPNSKPHALQLLILVLGSPSPFHTFAPPRSATYCIR